MINEKSDFVKTLYMRYAEDLFAYGMFCYSDKNLVEDAIHDIFIDIYDRKDNFERIRNMKYYLFSALRYRIYFLQKDRYLFDLENCDELFESDTPEKKYLEQEEANAQQQFVDRMLSHLNPHQREVIHLRLIEKLSFDQIAEIIKINPQSVQNLFGRAIAKLRKEFAI
jgi:RNA polymerase sigma factor (sigma-70 family)